MFAVAVVADKHDEGGEFQKSQTGLKLSQD